jgi:cytochrome c biogenesis protein CcmG/thiol:disulfide interchange protein DsbE
MGVLRMRVSLKFSMIVIILAAAAAVTFTGCKSGGGQAAALGSEKPLPNEPDVTFKDLQGKDVSLASLKGKVVVVNFWATWCEPCQVEIPWMIGFQKKYADRGFTLLGVAMDEEGKSAVEPFVQKTQFDVDGHPTTMSYPIVLGDDDLAGKFGGLLGLPTTYVITRDGKVAKHYIGLATESDLDKLIQSLL